MKTEGAELGKLNELRGHWTREPVGLKRNRVHIFGQKSKLRWNRTLQPIERKVEVLDVAKASQLCGDWSAKPITTQVQVGNARKGA